MGFFKTAPTDTKDKPFMLGVDMRSEIKCKDLPDLAKHLLWVNENIPYTERDIQIDTIADFYYSDHKYKINVRWKEQRGNHDPVFDDESPSN